MSSEDFDKLFGAKALEKGFITVDELFDAIKIKVTEEPEKRGGRHIGRIFFDMGVMSLAQIDEVLKSMDLLNKTNK